MAKPLTPAPLLVAGPLKKDRFLRLYLADIDPGSNSEGSGSSPHDDMDQGRAPSFTGIRFRC